jgi:hypothetical protein
MPASADHIKAAERNQQAIDYLILGGDAYTPWIITIAFYKALHMIEAVLAEENPPRHSADHSERNDLLKKTKKYEHFWRNYSPVYQASLVARYLSNLGGSKPFESYLTLEDCKNKLLNHRLRQIALTANRLIGNDVFSTK